MKKLLLAVIAALSVFASAAQAAAIVDGQGYVQQPPPEFDRPFDGKLEIIYDDDDPCSATGSRIVVACTNGREDFHPQPYMKNPGKCVIRLVRRVIEAWKVNIEDVVRHEIAHCNGWRHDAT